MKFKPQLLLGAALLCSAMNTDAQVQPATWATWAATSPGDQYTTDVSIDGLGNPYAAGFFKNSSTQIGTLNSYSINNTDGTGATEDGYVTKFDKTSGSPVWTVRIGGTGNDRAAAVAAFPSGTGYAIYVVGYFNGTATFESKDGNNQNLSSSGGQDAYIARYDQDGNLGWLYDIGGQGPTPLAEYAYDVAVETGEDGGTSNSVYIVGRNGSGTFLKCHGQTAASDISPSYQYGSDDGYLVKYVDQITYGTPKWIRVMGSTAADALYCVAAKNGVISVGGQFRAANMNLQLTSSTTQVFSTINGSYDIITANYSYLGNNNWYQQIGENSGLSENATCVTIDLNSNTYYGGFVASSSTGCSNYGNTESFVRKINSTGTTQWTACGGASGMDYASGIAIDRCSKHLFVGGVFLGPTFTFGSASLNAFVGTDNDNYYLELDPSNGSVISNTAKLLGSTGNDVLYSISTDRLDRVYFAGVSQGNWSWATAQQLWNSSAGTYDGYIWRYNEAIWPATGDLTSSDESYHTGISIDPCDLYCSGTFFGTETFGSLTPLSTTTYMSVPTFDTYLTRCDRFGHYQSFTKIASGTADERSNNQFMKNGNIYVAGSAEVNNGTTVVTNQTYNFTYSAQHAMLCKVSQAGTPVWTAFGLANNTSSYAEALGVTVDNSNLFVYVTGQFKGSVTFNGTTANTITLTSTGTGINLFLCKYTINGALVSAYDIMYSPNNSNMYVSDLYIDNSSNLYITGEYFGQATCVGSPNISLPTISTGDLYVARYSTTGLVQKAITYSGTTYNETGVSVVALNSSKVFVCGTTSQPQTIIGSCDLSTTAAWNWTPVFGTNSWGGAITADNNYIYATGTAFYNSFSTTFGSITLSPVATPDQVYLTKVAQSNGAVACFNALNYNSNFVGSGSNAIAMDGFTNNLYAAGAMGSSADHGMIHEFSPDNCDYSDRHGSFGDDASAAGNVSNALPRAEIFPNPSDGIIQIKLDRSLENSESLNLEIFDLSGRLVKTASQITNSNNSINASSLESGVYIYRISMNENAVGSGKIIITK